MLLCFYTRVIKEYFQFVVLGQKPFTNTLLTIQVFTRRYLILKHFTAHCWWYTWYKQQYTETEPELKGYEQQPFLNQFVFPNVGFIPTHCHGNNNDNNDTKVKLKLKNNNNLIQFTCFIYLYKCILKLVHAVIWSSLMTQSLAWQIEENTWPLIAGLANPTHKGDSWEHIVIIDSVIA